MSQLYTFLQAPTLRQFQALNGIDEATVIKFDGFWFGADTIYFVLFFTL